MIVDMARFLSVLWDYFLQLKTRAFAGIVCTDFANLLRRLSAMAFTANSLLYPCNTLSAIVNIVLSIFLGMEIGILKTRAFAGIVCTDFANLLRRLSARTFTANNLLYPCNTLSAIANIVLSISLGWEGQNLLYV